MKKRRKEFLRKRMLLNKKNGITLIALVITIVILIILATVTMNFVFGEDGLISRAQQAKDMTEESSANEEMSMYLADIKITGLGENNFRLEDYLSSNIGNEGLEDFINNGDGYGQVSYNGHKFLVNLDDYTFTYQGKSDGTVNRRIEQVLGNNNQSVPGIAMVEAGAIETEDLGWRVLNVNDDGTVNLIANKNTGFEVSLSGINGYTNGVKALNEICSKLYGGLEINGEKVISARSVNVEDFYDVTYEVVYTYTIQKIQPYINTLDVANEKFSTNQITDYIDPSNTSGAQSSNTQMLVSSTGMTIKTLNLRTEKSSVSMLNTDNNYWLATRYANSGYDSQGGTVADSENMRTENYGIRYIRADGIYANYNLFNVKQQETSGSNSKHNCALRPVITVPADRIENKTVGAVVEIDPFYKGQTGAEAHGYVKVNSIAELLGTDVKGVNYIESGLPTIESDMTWTKLEDGGYDSLTGEFDTENYDYYIADRTTKLQMRLTGAPAYNNGVLAMDTVMNTLYGSLTEIKLSDGSTKKVNVILARNAKFEDFYEDTGVSGNYGGVWSTNANDNSAPNKITSTNNRWAPTLFVKEDIDPSNGISDGYSDAKITSYNMSTTGTNNYLTDEQRNLYSYEKYNENPGLKVIYNALWSTEASRNAKQASVGTIFWLSSRCVSGYWHAMDFNICIVNNNSVFGAKPLFFSDKGESSECYGLRPVLQVEK